MYLKSRIFFNGGELDFGGQRAGLDSSGVLLEVNWRSLSRMIARMFLSKNNIISLQCTTIQPYNFLTSMRAYVRSCVHTCMYVWVLLYIYM